MVTVEPAPSVLPAAGIERVTEFTGIVLEYSEPTDTVNPAALSVSFAAASV